MHSIHKLYYVYFSHYTARLMNNNCRFFFTLQEADLWEKNGRRRNATQMSRQSFCPDYRANPSPSLSCWTILPQLPQYKANLIWLDLLCNMKTQGHKSFKAQSSLCWNTRSTNKHSLDSHMHGEHVKETSHPSREWIRVLWRTKLFNVWVANWYTRPALGQVLIKAINLLAACYTSARERDREKERVRKMVRERDKLREIGLTLLGSVMHSAARQPMWLWTVN